MEISLRRGDSRVDSHMIAVREVAGDASRRAAAGSFVETISGVFSRLQTGGCVIVYLSETRDTLGL